MVALKVLPTEVQLAVDLQPCLAQRRTYEGDVPHPCEFFADQGSFHSYDLRDPGPPPTPGSLQPVSYAGRRRVAPEMLSGCRKAPVMAVGINPNLPTFWPGKHNSVLPLFDDLLQYAHHFRYRAIGKLQIKKAAYDALLAGREDDVDHGPALAALGTPLQVELSNQAMYLAYQSVLDGLAAKKGWGAKKPTVGEDLSYGNMVACGSPRWITQPDKKLPSLPVMTEDQRTGIVDECFFERRHFLRQLFQSLPAVLLVFGGATRDAIITAMSAKLRGHPPPQIGEDFDALLDRRITLELGKLADGSVLEARVVFVPHASGNPEGFAAAREKVVEALVDELDRGNLTHDAATGHLVRTKGACSFCDNALYKIGACDYVAQLAPLAGTIEEGAELAASATPAAVRENAVQERMLADFVAGMSATRANLEEAGEEPTRLVLRGRVVTMDDAGVIQNGVVYVRGGAIEAIRTSNDPAPEGYAAARSVDTGGTIYPGLIDLHNHLAYNALPPWAVPKQYADRSQWRRAKSYAARIGAMRVLKSGDPARAVARYVEVKALLGGATTLQGMRSSFGSVSSAMKGLVRNVEGGAKGMPRAGSGVLDLEIGDPTAVARFREAATDAGHAYFYHLSEGVNDAALKLWKDLESHDLLGPSLVGIHCLGVPNTGFELLAKKGTSVVWSPTSNLMLYGQTLPLQSILASGVKWVLGCDWAPTGGKNPLFELKVAREVARAQGVTISARDLVAAVTTRAAEAVRWSGAVGKLAAHHRADLVVVRGADGDAYDRLIDATEQDVVLVMIDGVVRAGTAGMLDAAGVPVAGRESVSVGAREQSLWLAEEGSPLGTLTVAKAHETLVTRLADPNAEIDEAEEVDGFELVLDDEMSPLPSLEPTAEEAAELVVQVPDALVVRGDAALWTALETIGHFPEAVRKAVAKQYA